MTVPTVPSKVYVVVVVVVYFNVCLPALESRSKPFNIALCSTL